MESGDSAHLLNANEKQFAHTQGIVADAIARRGGLVDALRIREIDRVVYFHTDHFEPWRDQLHAYQIEQAESFAEQAAELPYSRKLTLFYNAAVRFFLQSKTPDQFKGRTRSIDEDGLAFGVAEEEISALGKRMLDRLLKSGHEIQVHVHHERITLSEVGNTPSSREIQTWLQNSSSVEQDESRFELYLEMTLDEIRRQTGLPLDRWAFVHGIWALNGSDPAVCRLRNEIQTLAKHGCFGDFTFPAGRKNVNPAITEPYTIVPFAKARCYDLPAAAPLLVREHPEALHDGQRFLIWASAVDARYSSLDYLSRPARETLVDADRMVLNWVLRSPRIGNTIYIKTHAHSMNWAYFESLCKPVIPHKHPEVQRGFSGLISACEFAGIKLDFMTVDEVFEELSKLPAGANMAEFGVPRSLDNEVPNSPEVLDILLTDALRTLAATEFESEVDRKQHQRAVKDGAFSRAELNTFRALAQEIGLSVPIVEVGAFGRLGLLFANRGNRVCVCDQNSARSRLMSKAIEALPPAVRRRLRLSFFASGLSRGVLHERIPEEFRAASTVIVTNDSSSGKSVEAFAAACAELRRFDTVYIDIRRFGRSRETEDELAALILRLEAEGLLFERRSFDRHRTTICRFRPRGAEIVASPNDGEPVTPAVLSASVADALHCLTLREREFTSALDPGTLERFVTETVPSGTVRDIFVKLTPEIDPTRRIVKFGRPDGQALLFANRGNPVCLCDESSGRMQLMDLVLENLVPSIRRRLDVSTVVCDFGAEDVVAKWPEAFGAASVALVSKLAEPAKSSRAFVNCCAALRRFEKAYIDLRSFGEPRKSEDEFAALVLRLATEGLVFEGRIFDGRDATIARFSPRAVSAEAGGGISPQALNVELSAVLRSLVALHADGPFTSDQQMQQRAEKESLFSDAELDMFFTLAGEIEPKTPVVEIGPFGRLALLFANRGNPVCICDRNPERNRLRKQLLAGISRQVQSRFDHVSAVAFGLGTGTLLAKIPGTYQVSSAVIVTNTPDPAASEQAFAASCDELKRFDVIYLDIRRFGKPRRTEEEFSALIGQMDAAGLVFKKRIFDRYNVTMCRFLPRR